MRGVGCVRGGLATALPPYALGLACAARRAMHRARVALIKEVRPRLVALGQTLGALEDLQRRPADLGLGLGLGLGVGVGVRVGLGLG